MQGLNITLVTIASPHLMKSANVVKIYISQIILSQLGLNFLCGVEILKKLMKKELVLAVASCRLKYLIIIYFVMSVVTCLSLCTQVRVPPSFA